MPRAWQRRWGSRTWRLGNNFRTHLVMLTLVTEAEEKRYAELQLLALDLARQGDTEQLAAMLDHGLPVNLADAKGQTLLMLACYYGNVATVRLLLERGAEVDRRNSRGQTPLGGAAFKGYEDVVKLLLEYGAAVNGDTGAGMPPIMFAAMFGRSRVVDLLIAYGAATQQPARMRIRARIVAGVSSLLQRLFGRRPARAEAM